MTGDMEMIYNQMCIRDRYTDAVGRYIDLG